MITRNRVPEAIEPLLQLPPETSLTILTATLGCSQTWLTARFIGNALQQGHCAVVLVSWLRDLPFWKSEMRRAMSVDASKAIERRHFSFIDGLTDQAIDRTSDTCTVIKTAVETAIAKIDGVPSRLPVLLILDGPDLLLATGQASVQQLNLLLLNLRSLAHSTILTCSADQPLLQAASQSSTMAVSPLETGSASFLTQQAHNAHLVLSVRELATGAARDISGVLRVTRSPCAYDDDSEITQNEPKEMEALYLVQRDGNVKVFQRGADAL